MSETSDALLSESAEPSYAVDRRAWVRLPSGRPVTCQPMTAASGEYQAARVQNISAAGVGLVVSRRFARGAVLQIVLPAEGDCPSQTLLARVVHETLISAYPGLRWLVGCDLLQRLSAEELQAITA